MTRRDESFHLGLGRGPRFVPLRRPIQAAPDDCRFRALRTKAQRGMAVTLPLWSGPLSFSHRTTRRRRALGVRRRRRMTARFRLPRPVFVDADWTFVDAPRPSVDQGATGPVPEYTGDCDAEQGIAMSGLVSQTARFPDGVARSHSAHCTHSRNRALLLRLVPAAARRNSRLRTSGRPARRQNELCTVASRGPRPPCRLRSTPHLRHRRDDGGRFAPHADRHRWRNGRRPIVVRRAADRPAGHRHPSGPTADAGRPGSCIQDGGTSATNPCRARDHCTVPTSATGWLR